MTRAYDLIILRQLVTRQAGISLYNISLCVAPMSRTWQVLPHKRDSYLYRTETILLYVEPTQRKMRKLATEVLRHPALAAARHNVPDKYLTGILLGHRKRLAAGRTAPENIFARNVIN